MGEFCQMTWTFQTLISSKNQQYGELKKLPYKKIFCTQEHLKNKLFHYQYVFTKTPYLQLISKQNLTKISRCRDKIMRRDEIRWFDGSTDAASPRYSIAQYGDLADMLKTCRHHTALLTPALYHQSKKILLTDKMLFFRPDVSGYIYI